ncbi:DUF4157 domain-containing protein [Massilia pseudoviolaceinigra]|uniref:DUF4157 domain-containing protein n=1 Tax=Massilia pseudoviolaceinigra TaxID=3057165 RepID=UPI002796832C|nr:DUF4157 domain-containing protein [Massilia sp. CCM 9206]MDQ1923219.1 DUF4157 domain-containing protein [Massilia sp. CCM 9206]
MKEYTRPDVPTSIRTNSVPAQSLELTDNRPGTARQMALGAMANGSSRVTAQRRIQDLISPAAASAHPAPRKSNRTGLPLQLKSGIESLSGMCLDSVRVHYNSSKPAQLNALAYAQSNNIYLAPSQEKHLPHEAWHVVQQAQGRVQPTLQMKGNVAVNDDRRLEAEADAMGEIALRMGTANTYGLPDRTAAKPAPLALLGNASPAQCAVAQLAKDADDFFSKYEVSNDIEIPFKNELISRGPELPAQDDDLDVLGIHSLIPTHPSGKSVDQIVATNITGFANPKDVQLRYGLSVGVNAYGGLDQAEAGRADVDGIMQAATPPSFPMSVLGFTWSKVWLTKSSGIPAGKLLLLGELAEMEEGEKEKVRKRETKSAGDENTFIYGAVREVLLKAEKTQAVSHILEKRPFIGRLYYHIGDDDAASMQAPPPATKKGVFDALTDEAERRLTADGVPPVLLGGGYRIRRDDNEDDPGDGPSENMGTELAEFASNIDQSVRAAMASVDPRIPYYSEANLLVDRRTVVANWTPDDPVSGEIFGKNTFESGNLKRFLGLYNTPPQSPLATQQSGFVPSASLVTGTKGSGKRFLAYHLKRPKNYLELAEDDIVKEYRKAVSTSQNAGSPANFAINLSIFFSKFGATVSATWILKRFLSILGTRGKEDPLYKSLSGEVQTRVLEKGRVNFSAGSTATQQTIESMTDAVSARAIEAHVQNFDQIALLIKGYVERHTFDMKGSARYNAEGGGSYDVLPIETGGIIPGCILMVEGKPKEVVSVGEFERYFKPITIVFKDVGPGGPGGGTGGSSSGPHGATADPQPVASSSSAQPAKDSFASGEIVSDASGSALKIPVVGPHPPAGQGQSIVVRGQTKQILRVQQGNGFWYLFFAT